MGAIITQEAFQILRLGGADIALVGRLKYSFELPQSFEEIVVFERSTVVSPESLDVHTYLSEEEVKNFNLNFVFHGSKEDVLKQGYLFLIPWQDFDESLELVNVMKGPNKVEKYRNPVIYYSKEKEEEAKNLYKKIKNIKLN